MASFGIYLRFLECIDCELIFVTTSSDLTPIKHDLKSNEIISSWQTSNLTLVMKTLCMSLKLHHIYIFIYIYIMYRYIYNICIASLGTFWLMDRYKILKIYFPHCFYSISLWPLSICTLNKSASHLIRWGTQCRSHGFFPQGCTVQGKMDQTHHTFALFHPPINR